MSRLSSILKLSLLIVTTASSVDIESTKEHLSCRDLPTAAIDIFWFVGVDTWYYTAGSRLDLYAFSGVLSGKDFDELREDEIYYNGCFKLVLKPWSLKMVAFGFKDQIKEYSILPISPFDLKKFNFIAPNGDTQGPCYTTLTDNEKFAFMVCCLFPDEMGWFVLSPFQTLPEDILKTIEDHATSLGFQQKNFVRLQYDSCDNDDKKNNLNKNLQDKNEL